MTDPAASTASSPAETAVPAPAAAPRRWPRRLAWAAGTLALLLATLSALLSWWLPDWIRPRIEAAATEALGTPVQIKRIELQPWQLDLRLQGLQVGPAEAPLLRLQGAQLQLAAESLWRLTPVVAQLRLDAPELWLQRQAPDRYNLSPVLEHLQARQAARPPQPAGEPARFALHNIELRDGRLHLHDAVLQQRHEIEALQIGLPFLSNLPSDVEVVVQPKLEARIDGSALGLAVQARPFAPGQPARLKLDWQDLALPPWLGLVRPLLPPAWTPTLDEARLDLHLALDFEQAAPTPRLRVQGEVALRQLDLAVPAQGLQARWQALQLRGLDLTPLAQQFRVGAIELDGLDAAYTRRAADPATAAAPPKPGAPAAKASAPAPASAASAAGPRWQVDALRCRDCRVALHDRSVEPALHLAGQAFDLSLQQLSDDGRTPILLALSLPLQAALGDQPAAAAGALQLKGELKRAPLDLQATLKLQELDLALLQPYLTPLLHLQLQSGRLGSEGQLTLQQGTDPAAALALHWQGKLGLAQLRSRDRRDDSELLRWQQLDLDGLDLSLKDGALSAELARLRLDGLDARALLRPDGTLNVADLLRQDGRAAAAAPASPAPAAKPAAATPAPRWHVAQLECRQCQLGLQDRRVTPASRIELQALGLQLRDLSSDPARPLQAALDTRLQTALDGRPLPAPGRIQFKGQVRQAPLALQADLQLEALDLGVLQPYLAPYVNLVLGGGRFGTQGRLALEQPAGAAAPTLRYQGDLALDGLRTQDGVTGEDFVNWQRLGLAGLDVGWNAGALRADLGRVRLSGLDARVILHPDGHLNLADVQRRTPDSNTSLTTPQAAASAPVKSAAASSPAPAASAAPRPDLRWQQIDIEQGELRFSDTFIRPNYSARLSRLQGSISALDASAPEPAQLKLAGALDDGAPLSITGRLNPLATPLYVDIEASARGIALPRLSTYAEQYTGYGIEKGALSATLRYQIEQGRLQADHRLYLDQLTFGERVERPSVTHLPVLLAVALLKDRHGVIDLHLPVAGTLDDPQFSVGAIVWQVLGNLISKAVTAPFALLLGDSAEDSGRLDFAPGSAELSLAARERLDALATKLSDRPGVRLEATGAADARRDAEALQRARAAAAAARAVSAPAPAGPARSGSAAVARPAASAAPVAAAASAPALPPIGETELRALADQRASRVMAYLTERLAPERILLNRSLLRDAASSEAGGVTLELR